MKTITTIGVDLAKNSFSIYGANAKGKCVLQRTLTRSGVIRFFTNLPECLVGLEACASSKYWAREIESLGHTVRRIHPRYVKPIFWARRMTPMTLPPSVKPYNGPTCVLYPTNRLSKLTSNPFTEFGKDMSAPVPR